MDGQMIPHPKLIERYQTEKRAALIDERWADVLACVDNLKEFGVLRERDAHDGAVAYAQVGGRHEALFWIDECLDEGYYTDRLSFLALLQQLTEEREEVVRWLLFENVQYETLQEVYIAWKEQMDIHPLTNRVSRQNTQTFHDWLSEVEAESGHTVERFSGERLARATHEEMAQNRETIERMLVNEWIHPIVKTFFLIRLIELGAEGTITVRKTDQTQQFDVESLMLPTTGEMERLIAEQFGENEFMLASYAVQLWQHTALYYFPFSLPGEPADWARAVCVCAAETYDYPYAADPVDEQLLNFVRFCTDGNR
ncbi:MAG: hypothetical protein ACRC5C_02885 [Bacilli bacterium]